MTLLARLLLISAFLGATLAAQLALHWHMRGGEALDYAHLRKSLPQLPLNFPASEDKSSPAKYGAWFGNANPAADAIIRAQLPFKPDDLLCRTYVKNDLSIGLNLYMVYSRKGEDRKHHPEICIRDVTGATEDLNARKILYVDAEGKRPIQRFRFRADATQYTTVYYWHYTLPRVPRAGETDLQVMYQRMNKPAPSITVQVSMTAELDQLEPVEKGFLVSLDQAMRDQQLPDGAVMGCDRIPIALLRTGE
jgi:hypothetical protein